jgi:hypothetical protein
LSRAERQQRPQRLCWWSFTDTPTTASKVKGEGEEKEGRLRREEGGGRRENGERGERGNAGVERGRGCKERGEGKRRWYLQWKKKLRKDRAREREMGKG